MLRIAGWLLIAVTCFYYFGLLIGAATYPGFSHVTRYASELGMAEAPYPAIFNISAMLCGLSAIGAAVLLPASLPRIGAARLWLVLAAIALVLWGIGTIMAGLFPIPDERHGGFGLGLGGPLIPLFLLLSIRRLADTGAIKIFLAVIVFASIAMFAIMFGVGHLVTSDNVGLWQRLNSVFSIGWFAVFGVWLLLRARRYPQWVESGH